MRLGVFAMYAAIVGLTVPVSEAGAFNWADDNDEIRLYNNCVLPMRVLVHFKDKRTGGWTTTGWHSMSPTMSATLYRGDRPLLSGSNYIYFYAEIPGYGMEIRGNEGEYSEIVEGRRRVFSKSRYERTGFWAPIVGGFFTRMFGLDEYVKGFDCRNVKEQIWNIVEERVVYECLTDIGDITERHEMAGTHDLTGFHRDCQDWIFEQERDAWMERNRIR